MGTREADDISASANVIRMQSIDLSRHSDEAMELKNVLEEHQQKADIYSMVILTAKDAFRFITSLKLELITFLYMTAFVVRSNTGVAILMERVCRVHLSYSDDVCDHLDEKRYSTQKTLVEKMANNYHVGHTLLATVPSGFLSCFVGPWSDRYSRRLPIIVGLSGIILDDLLSALWAYNSRARSEFYFIPPLFSGFSGGFISTLTVVYSYASDTTLAKQRTMKYTLLEVATGLALPFGVFNGGKLYKYFGPMPVYATALAGHTMALIMTYFFLKETRGIGNKDTWREKIRAFFSSRNFLEGFKVALKNRPDKGRLQLWMLVLALSLSFLVMAGSAGINFLFVHHHYSWDNEKYSTVSSVFSVMTLVVMMAAVPVFTKLLHIGDPMLGIIGSVSSLAKQICTSLAVHEGLFYLGNLLGLLSGIPSLAGKARFSKIIPKDDLGKVFAFLTTVETVLPIAATAVVSQMFNATMDVMPAPTFLFLSLCVAVTLGVFIWSYCLPKVNYEELRDEEDRRKSLSGSINDNNISS